MANSRQNNPRPTGGKYLLGGQNFADPDEMRLKLRLANRFAYLVTELELTQSMVGLRTGLAQSDVSRIVNGRVKNYSVWRLIIALTALGQIVNFTVKPAGQEGRVDIVYDGLIITRIPQVTR